MLARERAGGRTDCRGEVGRPFSRPAGTSPRPRRPMLSEPQQMSNRTPLSVVRVEKPCPADWDHMAGDGAVRFCQHCQKHVHDLSAMPADAAERLVCLSADKMCVRYAAGADGQPLTLEYLRQTPPRWRWRVWTVVAVSLALVSGTVQALFFGKRV